MKSIFNKIKAQDILFYAVIALVVFGFSNFRWLFYITFYRGYHGFYTTVDQRLSERFGLDLNLAQIPYDDPVIFLSALANPIIAAGIVLSFVPLILNYRALQWRQFKWANTMRWLIFGALATLAWTFSTYDYNLYFNFPHHIDRFLLVLLVGLVFWHPAFIPVFLAQFFLVMAQFTIPLDGLTLADKSPLFHIPMLFAVCLYLVAASRLKPSWYEYFRENLFQVFLVLSLSLLGANYFMSAIEKIRISPGVFTWMFENELFMHAIHVLSRGWWGTLDENAKGQIVEMAKLVAVPFQFFAFFVEFLGLAMLARRRWTIVFIMLFTLLHIGIFLESGIFFWKWIILNFLLAFLLWKMPANMVKQLFSKRNLVVSVIVIVFSGAYFYTVNLGWYDARLFHYFEIEGVGESGETYEIEKNFMDPYHMYFSFNRYLYLVDMKVVRGSSYELIQKLKTLSRETLPAYVEAEGVNFFDQRFATRFDTFVQRFFTNLYERGHKELIWSRFDAPHHIWTFAEKSPYQLQERLTHVQVRFVQKFYDGQEVFTFRNEIVRTIPIL